MRAGARTRRCEEIRAGLIGFGTIGTGVVKLLQRRRAAIDAMLGSAAAAGPDRRRRHDARPRRARCSKEHAGSPTRRACYAADDVDVVIELMGGYEPARRFVLAAIGNGKSIVTANKALLAVHGREVFGAAAPAARRHRLRGERRRRHPDRARAP